MAEIPGAKKLKEIDKGEKYAFKTHQNKYMYELNNCLNMVTSPLGPHKVTWFLALNSNDIDSGMSDAHDLAAAIHFPSKKCESLANKVSISFNKPNNNWLLSLKYVERILTKKMNY